MTDRLPTGFITTTQAAGQRGFSVRTARNRCLDHRIGIKVGREWWVWEPGLAALQTNDTGDLDDAQRYVRHYQPTE